MAHPALIADLVWSPDDRRLALQTGAANSFDNDFELWDLERGALVHREAAGAGTVDVHFTPTFSSDGRLVFFAGKLDAHTGAAFDDRPSLKVFDVGRAATWREISVAHPNIPPRCDRVSDECMPWGRLGPPLPTEVVFDRSLEFVAVRWSLETPLQLWNLLEDRSVDIGSNGRVEGGVRLSPDGNWLLWGQAGRVERWSRATRRRGSTLTGRHPSSPVLAITMHQRRAEALVLNELSIAAWSLATGRRLWETDFGRDPRTAVSVDPRYASASYLPGDRVLVRLRSSFLLEARTGRVVQTDPGPNDDREHPVPDESLAEAVGRHVGAWNEDGAIRAVHPDTDKIITVDPTPRRAPVQLALTADRRRLLVADGSRGDVVWFDLAKGERHVLCEPIDPLPGGAP